MSSLLKSGSNKNINYQRQEYCWNAYMRIYKNEAYHSKEFEGWVHDKLRQHPELCYTTLIYHNEDRNDGYLDKYGRKIYGSDDKIIENLMYPIPIFWGSEQQDKFDWDEVKNSFGYNRQTAITMPDEIRDTIRYAIVGPVKVKAYKSLPERDANVIHTEGVNLESKETVAYKNMILGNHKDDILREYFRRHRGVLKLIIEAAMSQTKKDETAFIQAPMIGAGCFLKGIENNSINIDKDNFLTQQIIALLSVLNTAPPEYSFTFKLCIFNSSEFSKKIIDTYKQIEKGFHGKKGRFILAMDQDGGNVLSNVPFNVPKQKVFVVNPGDLRSFIGNGMSHENSVEGYIVADANGYNPQWQNTSFLHNPYFNPDLFSPVKSALSGNIVWKETSEW